MSPSDQAVMMNKLTSFWPYEYERRALNWPMHIGLITNCITSSMIATKINSDMVMFNPKMSFLESVKKCPKSPLIFGIYSSGLTYYVTQQVCCCFSNLKNIGNYFNVLSSSCDNLFL
uniref:Mitochondrial pyruvate carrier n=1 Tax=Heterorhabditis bacteriophora TaxID=37862 RepID=A0A1I7WSI8_HETBA